MRARNSGSCSTSADAWARSDGHSQSRNDEEEGEHDGDPEVTLDTPSLHPADGWTHRSDDEESDGEHQEDRPEPEEQPHAAHDEDEVDHRRGRYLEAHHARLLLRGGRSRGERRNVGCLGLDVRLHVLFSRVTVGGSGVPSSLRESNRFAANRTIPLHKPR